MKERPILMSSPMVRALLDGTKTQTRRAVKPQPTGAFRSFGDLPTCDCHPFGFHDGHRHHACPYGQPGDRLWVRETWRGWLAGAFPCVDYQAGGGDEYGADPPAAGFDADHPCWSDWKWRPSIFMPRWASRITLEIVAVKVERLRAISHPDIAAEGIVEDFDPEFHRTPYYFGCDQERFRNTWDAIHGPGSWDANPWVWCVSFRRLG